MPICLSCCLSATHAREALECEVSTLPPHCMTGILGESIRNQLLGLSLISHWLLIALTYNSSPLGQPLLCSPRATSATVVPNIP